MSRLRLIVPAVLALVLALPAAVSADTVVVIGTVTAADATTPAADVEIAVRISGSDEIFQATSDAAGAWSLPLDLVTGDVLEVSATGASVRSAPDDGGCITVTTPTARVEVTIGETAPESIAIVLDGEIASTVCSATATPGTTRTARPAVTPPSTDARDGGGWDAGAGALIIAGGLALLSAALFLAATPRRTRPVTVRR
jgi:hypothetical protein